MSTQQPKRPPLTADKVVSFMKEQWGATEVIVLGDPDDAIWVYYRGVHPTIVDYSTRERAIEASLTRFMMEHGDYEARFRDGQYLLQLRWRDQRCAMRWPFPVPPRDPTVHRTDEICRVGDAVYSHDGRSSTYTVCVDEGNGKHFLELKDIPGFKESVQKRYEAESVTFAFEDRTRFDPAFKAAADLIWNFTEEKYWDRVADFLVERHEKFDAVARLKSVLLDNGFTEEEIKQVGITLKSLPVEPC